MRRLLLVIPLLLLGEAPARAVTLIKDGVKIHGYLVEKTSEKIVIRRAGSTKTEEYPLAGVTVLEAFNPRDLEALKRDRPERYRELADELAEKKDDPEARDLALRLYLLAAWLNPQKLGRSCLLSMAQLAWKPEDARRFRALAYLLDPQKARDVIKPTPAGKDERDDARKHFIDALRALRSGRAADAKRTANLPGVAEKFKTVPGLMSHAEFLQACDTRNFQLPDEQLKLFIQAELDFVVEVAQKKGKWSTSAGSKPVPPLSLETLLDGVDPRKCVYRAGQWVEP